MAYRAPPCDLGPIRLNIYARKKSFVPNGQMSNNRDHQHPQQQHLDLLLGGYILKAKGGSRIIFTTRSYFEEIRPGTLFRPLDNSINSARPRPVHEVKFFIFISWAVPIFCKIHQQFSLNLWREGGVTSPPTFQGGIVGTINIQNHKTFTTFYFFGFSPSTHQSDRLLQFIPSKLLQTCGSFYYFILLLLLRIPTKTFSGKLPE